MSASKFGVHKTMSGFGDRNGIVLHGDTKFHFLSIQQNPVLITAGAVRIIGAEHTS